MFLPQITQIISNINLQLKEYDAHNESPFIPNLCNLRNLWFDSYFSKR